MIFVGVYLVTEFALRMFMPAAAPTAANAHVTLKAQATSVRLGHAPAFILENHTQSGVTLLARCPQPPLNVGVMNGTQLAPLTASGTAIPCPIAPLIIASGASATIDMSPWKYSLFSKAQTYGVSLPSTFENTGTGSVTSTTVTMTEPGVFVQLFRAFITKPFLNLLVFIASLLPNHDLGIAIIVLTLIVKLVLYIPTQHALEGQKKMQMLQPKIEEIKRQYKGNAVKVNEETMKLWKEHKINPFSSCLPVLLQFPVLIGLFYVIRDGSVLTLSTEFLYPMYTPPPFQFGVHFLGFDLTQPSKIIFPVLLVVLQFLQMKLTFHIASKKKGADAPAIDSAQLMQQRMMLYVLPLMIGFFAFRFPTAVSLYWAVSTLFAIGQQLVVNRKALVA